MVLRVTGVVLLLVRRSDRRMRGHNDARPGARTTREPGAFSGLHVSVRVELRSVLTEVPDVPIVVLGVVVEGRLGQRSLGEHVVADDGAGDTGDRPRAVGHDDDVPRRV